MFLNKIKFNGIYLKTFSPQSQIITLLSFHCKIYAVKENFFAKFWFPIFSAISLSDKKMIKKRLTNTSDEDSDNDEETNRKPQKTRRKRLDKSAILMKILNRSTTGFFNASLGSKSNQKTFTQPTLKFCLRDIIPYRFINDHIFMGLSACGNFLISYKRVCCESETSINYDFNCGYKYELFFWIYRPHMALSKYVSRT